MSFKFNPKSIKIGVILLFLLTTSLIFCLFMACGDKSGNPTGSSASPYSDFEWTRVSPAEHGFDSTLLDSLTHKIYVGQFGRITGLLIARNGDLVYEEYFRGKDSNSLVNIYSCTKSINSALIGIAINEGKIGGVDDRLFDYLDGYTLFPDGRNDSLRREQLTIEHLLTMTAGFAWEEMAIPYGEPINSYTQMVNSDNWIQYTLNRPIEFEPGETFEYNTGLSGLMAVILSNSTGQRVDYYARNKLFRCIGIDTCTWRVSPRGVYMTGNGIKLRPRDMAKFGQLYAQNGIWEGKSIVPGSWVQKSFQRYTELPDGRSYGYQWWIAELTDNQNNTIDLPYALGWGGQHIFVSQDYNLVIVVTANDDINVSENYIGGIMHIIGRAFTLDN